MVELEVELPEPSVLLSALVAIGMTVLTWVTGERGSDSQ